VTVYAVVGSRTFENFKLLNEVLSALNITKIVSGGAKGADSLVAKYAKANKILLEEHIPEWDKYGKSAGFKRNARIIDSCDEVIAFWDGISKGTAHSVAYAKARNKPVFIFWDDLDEN
jgi:predicted Rossmann fold nucleotide-binding protein DprA/Smf involved in DNA uptake